MAQTENKKTGAPHSKYAPAKEHIINAGTIKKTWTIRPPQDWLALLTEIAPSNKWQLKGQTTITGKCPYHDDKTPSFVLSFDKCMGKCFGGGCEKVVVDITSLVARLKNSSYVQALMFIYNRFNMGDALSTSVEDYTLYNRTQEMKKAVAVGMSKIMYTLANNSSADYLKYCEPAVDYLLNVRKLPKSVIHLLPVGVWVKPIHMKHYIPQNLQALYEEYFAKIIHPSTYGSLCYYYNDSPGSISRFKIRHMNQQVLDQVKTPEAFLNLPLEKRALLFSKNETQYVEDPYTSNMGVFGMFNYQALIGKKDTNAYITEGEFDVLSPMAAQYESGELDFMVFGTGGKGSVDIQFLREYGIRNIWLVGDHPMKQGDKWVESVLNTKNNFVSSAGVTPLQFRVFQWPMSLTAEDLDDAVKKHGYQVVRDILYNDRNSHFLNSVAWVKKKVDNRLEILDQKKERKITLLESSGEERATEVSNIEDTHKANVEQHILKGFQLVHAPRDKQEYVRSYAASRGVDISIMDSVHSSMYALDTMQGVVERVIQNMDEYFSMAYYVKKAGDQAIYVWSKKNEELVEVPVADQPLMKTIALFTDQEIEQWFDSMLGHNPVYCEGIDEKDLGMKASRTKQANALYITKKAFNQRASKMPSFSNLTLLSQGIHHRDLPNEMRQDNLMYFVNGPSIYRGQFTQDGGDLEWSQVRNAVDRTVLFEDLNRNETWSSIQDTTDLYDAHSINLNDVFKDIRKMLDGWVFDNHDITAEYLAAYIMSLPVMRAVSDINITLLTGEKVSGKTTFSAGLLGGSGAKRNVCPYILESVFQIDNATLPAIYQATEGKSHLVVFDEAEHGDRYNTLYDDVLSGLRRLVHSMPHGGVVVRRGGRTKEEKVKYFLRWPMLMAAIHPPSDPVFLTRTIEVRTKRQMNHVPIEEYIEQHFSMKKIWALRKQITTGLLPRIPELMQIRRDLRIDLQRVGRAEAMVSNRFLDNVVTPLAVYKLLGGDASNLYASMVRYDRNKLEAIHSNDPQNDLITTCLYTQCIRTSLNGESIVTDVSAHHLISNREYTILNNSGSGVFSIPQMGVIVIAWRQAKFGALARTKYASWEVSMLRETAHKTDTAILNISETQHKDICRILNMRDVHSQSGYTVVEESYLLPNRVMGESEDSDPGVQYLDEYAKKKEQSAPKPLPGRQADEPREIQDEGGGGESRPRRPRQKISGDAIPGSDAEDFEI